MIRKLIPGALAMAMLAGCGDKETDYFEVRAITAPAAEGSMAPNLAAGPGGAIMLSWIEPRGSGHRLAYSRLDAESWSEPRTIAQGQDWFVNWADFPSMIALSGKRMAAHWLVRSGQHPYAYDVHVSLSEDGGQTWSDLGPIHDDGTQTEHGFVSFYAYAQGNGGRWPGLIWLDGRKTMAEPGAAAAHHGSGGGMTLRHARIGPGGAVTEEIELDGLTCDCCQTAAVSVRDEVLVAYRDRSEQEIRDVRIMRRDDDGWHDEGYVFEDGWEIHGCPVNGPVLAAHGDRVVIAWFTAAGGLPRVMAGFSADRGRSFRVEELEGGAAIGRVSAVVTGDGAAISWLSGDDEGAGIRLLRFDRDGSALGQPRTVVTSHASRSSGFPRLLAARDGYLLAWTEPEGESRRVQTARIAVSRK